jgi:hypothetical protein
MTQLTRQPVSGRANDGGLRIGEMERDSIISHGATEFLKESMLVRGDQYYMAVCNKTGGIAIYNPDRNMFMSPLADGPLKFVDSLDGTSSNIEHVTKFGRSFSVVRVPYVFKLFMQELQAINVKIAIITEDNVDQFDNMNFSRNISLLTNGKTLQEIMDDVAEVVDKKENIKIRQYVEEEESPDSGLIYKKGAQVEVKNEDERKWYPAIILYGHLNNTYDVEYGDGELQNNVPEHLIKPLYGAQPVAQKPVLEESESYEPFSPPGSPSGSLPGSPLSGSPLPGSPLSGSPSTGSLPESPSGSPGFAQGLSPGFAQGLSPGFAQGLSPGLPYNSFKVGDSVSYTKDFKNRMWKIEELRSDYVVLNTEDNEGLDNKVKVVGLGEITQFVPSTQYNSQPQQFAAAPPPIVNVMVGNNNNMTSPEKRASQPGFIEESLSQDSSSDFSTPRIRFKEDPKVESDANMLSGGKTIVVKKI